MHEPYITIEDVKRPMRHAPFSPEREPSLHFLDAIIGTWSIRGTDGLMGTQTYEWLEGDYYVEHHWRHVVQGKLHSGFALIGYDDENDELFVQMGDNLGYAHRYKLLLEPLVLHFFGRTERATFTIAKDRSTFRAEWEQNKDGRNWTHLCTMHGQRTQA